MPAFEQATDVATTTAAAIVHAGRPGAVINRELFGHSANHLGHGGDGGIWVGEKSPNPNYGGYRRDVLRAIKVPVPPISVAVLDLR